MQSLNPINIDSNSFSRTPGHLEARVYFVIDGMHYGFKCSSLPYTSAMGQSIVNFIVSLSKKEVEVMVERLRFIKWKRLWFESSHQPDTGTFTEAARIGECTKEIIFVGPYGDLLLKKGFERDLPAEFLVKIFKGLYSDITYHHLNERHQNNDISYIIDFENETLVTQYQRSTPRHKYTGQRSDLRTINKGTTDWHEISFEDLRQTHKYDYMEQLEWIDLGEPEEDYVIDPGYPNPVRHPRYWSEKDKLDLGTYQIRKSQFQLHALSQSQTKPYPELFPHYTTPLNPHDPEQAANLYSGFRASLNEMRPNLLYHTIRPLPEEDPRPKCWYQLAIELREYDMGDDWEIMSALATDPDYDSDSEVESG